ncbi:MAG TPA: heme-binding protein [Ramlibacter sp.]|nr:heme-binding protein [Ramlibacter sp.]
MRSLTAIGLAAVLCAATSFTAAQTLVAQRTISLDAAQELAGEALRSCRKEGHRVSITVLDAAGRTAVVLHDDGAGLHTIEHSLRKAHTAFVARQPSGDYGKRVISNPAGASILQLQNMTLAEGGLPILAGRELVGAIGISGAPGGDKDAACAQAGIDRISKNFSGG